MRDPAPSFEQVFANLVLPEPAGARPEAASHPPSPDVEPRIREALLLFAEGRHDRSARVLESTEAASPADPRVAALAAAHRAFATGRLYPGIQCCLRLLEARPDLPDLYAVLGVLLRKAKQRSQAHDAFRIGLRLAPAHPGLQSCLADMGARREPVLPFLPRSHPANRLCGRVRAWLRVGRQPPVHP